MDIPLRSVKAHKQRCPRCQSPLNTVVVHGHEQCAVCKSNIFECCSGDTCDADHNLSVGYKRGSLTAMKHIHALLICLMALASPTLAETDPVPYEAFLAENDISFTASEVLEGYRINGCEENEGVRDYRPNIDYDPVFMMGENR